MKRKEVNLASLVDQPAKKNNYVATSRPFFSTAKTYAQPNQESKENVIETFYSAKFKYPLPFFQIPGLRYVADMPKVLDTKEDVHSWCDIPKILAELKPSMLLQSNGNKDLFPGITFLEGPHEYWLSQEVYNRLYSLSSTADPSKWNHHRFYGSVTKMAGKCFAPFVEENSIGGIQGGKNYHTPGYEYYEMTAAQISNSYLAGNLLGTMLHYMIELFFNGFASVIPPQLKDKAWQQFEQFYVEKIQGKYVPFMTELRVYSMKYDLAGSIDFICVREEEWHAAQRESRRPRLTIIDWKRAKDFKRKAFTGEMASPPLECFPDTTFFKYIMQLNIYKKVIEMESPYIVEALYLCRFHPSNETYEYIEVPFHDQLVQKLLDLRLAEIQLGLGSESH